MTEAVKNLLDDQYLAREMPADEREGQVEAHRDFRGGGEEERVGAENRRRCPVASPFRAGTPRAIIALSVRLAASRCPAKSAEGDRKCRWEDGPVVPEVTPCAHQES